MIVKKVSYIIVVYKFNCSSGIIDLFVILIYVLSAFAGGITGGKLIKERKFLWGLIIGTIYACIIIIVSIANHGGVSMFSGTLGGMLG